MDRLTEKGLCFEIRVFLLLDGLPTMANKLFLREYFGLVLPKPSLMFCIRGLH